MHRASLLGVLSFALAWALPLVGQPIPPVSTTGAPYLDVPSRGGEPTPPDDQQPNLDLVDDRRGGPTVDTVRFTLDGAVERALSVSPDVRARAGAVRAPRGERAEERWPFPSNPILRAGRVRREAPGGDVLDQEWALTQEIEIAGQNFVRAGAAGRRVAAAEARVGDARRLTALEARRLFVTLALAERRATLTDSAAVFAERLTDVARRQLEAGEINRLTYNATVLEAARQRSVADRALADLDAAAADFARLLALPTRPVPRTTPLPELPDGMPDVTAVMSIARERRPDLRAAELGVEAADQSVTASRLGLVPNLIVGGFLSREEGVDLTGFSLGMSIPLFHRQQAATGRARAEAAAAQAVSDATARRVTAEVSSSLERFRRSVTAERRVADEVLRAASENVVLTERAFAEGKVDITDMVVLRSTAVDAQLEYLTVRWDAYTAWFDLAAALGVAPPDLFDLSGASR